MTKYLLETTPCSRIMENDLNVQGHLDALAESDYPCTCTIVKGEILFGIERLPTGRRRQDLEHKANRLFSSVRLSRSCPPRPYGAEGLNSTSEEPACVACSALLRGLIRPGPRGECLHSDPCRLVELTRRRFEHHEVRCPVLWTRVADALDLPQRMPGAALVNSPRRLGA